LKAWRTNALRRPLNRHCHYFTKPSADDICGGFDYCAAAPQDPYACFEDWKTGSGLREDNKFDPNLRGTKKKEAVFHAKKHIPPSFFGTSEL
jgi:hypothetical protein